MIRLQEYPHIRLSYILDDIDTFERYVKKVRKAENEATELFDALERLPLKEKPASVEGIYNLYDFRMELLTLGVPVREVYKFDIKPEPELNITIIATHKVMEMIKVHDEAIHRYNDMLRMAKKMLKDINHDLKQFNADLDNMTPDDLEKYHLSDQEFLELKKVGQQLEKRS